MKKSLKDSEIEILVNGDRLNNIRYADDTIIFADSLEGLQTLKIPSTSTPCMNF